MLIYHIIRRNDRWQLEEHSFKEIAKKIGYTAMTITKAEEFYNNKRPHMSLGMLTPADAANHEGTFKKLWTSYRELTL